VGAWGLHRRLPLFDENLTLDVDPGIPDGGTYEGPEGVREYMSRFLDPWESITIAGESFKEVGDTILVGVRQSGIGRGSGAPSRRGTSSCGPSEAAR